MEKLRNNLLSRTTAIIVNLGVPLLVICMIAAVTFAICYYIRIP